MAKTNDWGRAELLTADDTYNIIATSQGLPGSGKTHFWLTFPEPIAFYLFDPGGLKGLKANELFTEKEVRVFDFCGDENLAELPKEDRVQTSIDMLERFKEDFAIGITKARTLVVDKESMLWEVIRYAHDEVDSPQPKNFHELNLMMRAFVQKAEAAQVNLGFLRDVKEKWGKTGVSRNGNIQMGYTGVWNPEGHTKLTGLVQLNLAHRWDDDEREFKVKFLEKCRLGPAKKLLGTEETNLDYETLMALVFPDVDVAELNS